MRWAVVITLIAALIGAPAYSQMTNSAAPFEEWQTSWKKFDDHVLAGGADLIAATEATARQLGRWEPAPGTSGLVVTNGSLELALALSNGPNAPSELTDKHKKIGFGADVEFPAGFKGIVPTSDGEKKKYKSDIKLEFDKPVGGPFWFPDTTEPEIAKWKAAKPGSKIKVRAKVNAIALWPIKFGTTIPIVAFTNARIVE